MAEPIPTLVTVCLCCDGEVTRIEGSGALAFAKTVCAPCLRDRTAVRDETAARLDESPAPGFVPDAAPVGPPDPRSLRRGALVEPIRTDFPRPFGVVGRCEDERRAA